MKKILIVLLLLSLTYSCDYFSSDENDEVFLIIRKKIIEEFENSKVISKVEYSYNYERVSDFFWKSAEVEYYFPKNKKEILVEEPDSIDIQEEVIEDTLIKSENKITGHKDTLKTIDTLAHNKLSIDSNHANKNDKKTKKPKSKKVNEKITNFPIGNIVIDFLCDLDLNIFKNNKSKNIKIQRQLDSTNRTPIKELFYSIKKIIKSRNVSYSAKTYELIELKEFTPKGKLDILENLIVRKFRNGLLVSEIFESINHSSHKKISYISINHGKNLPRGYFNVYSYILANVNFHKSNTDQHTKMNKKGIPKNYVLKTLEKDSIKSYELWLKSKLEDGRLVSLKTYNFRKMDSANKYSSEFLFEYDSDGLIERIEEYKFNPEEGEFDLFTDMQLFEWINPEIPGRYNYIDYNFTKETYNYKTHIHSIYERKIVKFDEVGKKVIEEYFDSYKGEYNSGKFHPKLIKRTTLIYDRLEKKGEAVVMKKNKLYKKN